MVGNIVLKSATIIDQKRTGNAIIALSKSVSDMSPGSEWMKFKADPKAWLHSVGYVYKGPGETPDGKIPASVKLVPVYDTENTMHVRIPWKGNVDPVPLDLPFQEDDYGDVARDRFPILLARYFMRKCR